MIGEQSANKNKPILHLRLVYNTATRLLLHILFLNLRSPLTLSSLLAATAYFLLLAADCLLLPVPVLAQNKKRPFLYI